MYSTAFAACFPSWGTKDKPCECAYPTIDSNGKIVCGRSYCGDKKCMPDGSCCEIEKYCENTKNCCSSSEICVNKTTCCPVDKPYLDAAGNCLQCSSDSHCEDDETCDTATGTCKEASKTCTSDSECSGDERCCAALNKCIGKKECCGTPEVCSLCKQTKCYTNNTSMCTPDNDCAEIILTDAGSTTAGFNLDICPTGGIWCTFYAISPNGTWWETPFCGMNPTMGCCHPDSGYSYSECW